MRIFVRKVLTTPAAFTIYNASAGAGKTYTLVKEYLTKLFNSGRIDGYRTILAVTFTNKAVAEMKARIIEYLRAFSEDRVPSKYSGMFQEILDATKLDETSLRLRSQKTLKSIIHNYAAFDVLTIDTFTHRIIRTFANDLDIPMNFEVEMDSDSLLEEAIALLISKVGIDKRLTQIIIDFALSKLDDDKSWDISKELHQVGRLLFSENDLAHLSLLQSKKPEDFEVLKKAVLGQLKTIEAEIVDLANNALLLLENNGLSEEDFYRKQIPLHFENFVRKKTTIKSFDAKWKQEIETTPFYTTKLNEDKKGIIDQIRPELVNVFNRTKDSFFELQLLQNIYKNLTPLSVLSAIQTVLSTIKKERNILLISEFNNIVSKAIKDEPAPFIYERLGERYQDYFIDEFQDTSVLQWENMIPLADNALSSETLEGKRGSMTIVGDAKQAIYRWRGGKAEQFMKLYTDKNPFSVDEKRVLDLPCNYRSYSEIIQFNNSFFSHIAQDFSTEIDKQLYVKGNAQLTNDKKGGYVRLSFIEAANVQEEDELYPVQVYKAIQEVLQKGYSYNEVCILTRKLRQGIVLANYLTAQGVPIISSETLLISNAPEVRFLVNLLQLFVQPNDKTVRVQLLHFLADRCASSSTHEFIASFLDLSVQTMCKELESYGFHFSFHKLQQMTLYESVEYCIESFDLHAVPSAYLQFFLDVVFEYGQKNTTGISGFLAYWELKKDKLSIAVPAETAAVQIMTVHKSKGLEFPVVLYPYVNDDIYYEKDPKTWYPLDPEKFAGFNEGFLSYNSGIGSYSDIGAAILQERQAKQELDGMNILYVAMTRAVEQLYIFTKKELTSKGGVNARKYSGKFIQYLQAEQRWDPLQDSYDFGTNHRVSSKNEQNKSADTHSFKRFFCTSKETHNIVIVTNGHKIWNSKRQEAIAKGVLLHELLAKIYLPEDIPVVIDNAILSGEITLEQKAILLRELEAIVAHPILKEYYKEDQQIFNERAILHQGEFYRPDRLMIRKNKTVVIDYKTGHVATKHKTQVQQYASIMEKMGYEIEAVHLVYITPFVTVVNI